MIDPYTPSGYTLVRDLLVEQGKRLFGEYPIDIGDLEFDLDRYNPLYIDHHRKHVFTGFSFIESITKKALKKINKEVIKNFIVLKDIEVLSMGANNELHVSIAGACTTNNRENINNQECPLVFPLFTSLSSRDPINLGSKKFIKNLTNLLKRDEIRKRTRDALSSGELKAYCLQRGPETVPSYLWLEDNHWYSLLLDNAIYLPVDNVLSQAHKKETKKIYFKKEEVDRFLSNTSRDHTEITPEESPLIGFNDVTKNMPHWRAPCRLLYILLSKLDDLKLKNKKGEDITLSQFIKLEKKDSLSNKIKELARLNNIQTFDNIQEGLKGKSDIDIEELNRTALSEQDIKAIATLLRHLQQQRGNVRQNNVKKEH